MMMKQLFDIVKIVLNHPTETIIKQLLFRVPCVYIINIYIYIYSISLMFFSIGFGDVTHVDKVFLFKLTALLFSTS